MKNTLIYSLVLLITISSTLAFLGTDSIIKFDDEKSNIIIKEDGDYGCGVEGKLFFKFISEETISVDKVDLNYDEGQLHGTFYKRDKLGFFKEVKDTIIEEKEYYFFSNPIKKSGTYKVDLNNLKAAFLRNFEVECPKFRYTCDDFKPVIDTCYNTEDGELIIEFGGANIDDGETLSIDDLFIHTKGDNELVDEADNILSNDAKLEKIGDKYRITSTVLVGNPRIGTNNIEVVYFQPKACFLDLYSDAYTYKDCEGIKEVVEDKENVQEESIPPITGATVGAKEKSKISIKYWLLGFVLILLGGVLYWKRK